MGMTDANEPWVVVYDGECSFCLQQIARIRRRDSLGRFEFLPRQADGLADRFPALADGEFNTGMRLIRPDGHIFVGADSMYHIARQLPMWRCFAWLYRMPGIGALARAAYAWVAAHRHSLAKGRSSDTSEASNTPQGSGKRD